MKKIEIDPCLITKDKHEDCYQLRLGNDTLHRFGQKKQAVKFLAKTNKFLTKILFEYNCIYSEVHHKYREIWIHVNPGACDNEASEIVDGINFLLNRSWWSARGERNGAQNAFITMEKIGNELKCLCSFSLNTIRKQSNTFNNYYFTTTIQRINEVQNRCTNFGTDTAAVFGVDSDKDKLKRLNIYRNAN